MAQVLQFGLKCLLSDRYDVDLGRLERSTIAQTVRQLRDYGLAPDYIILPESLVEY